MRIFAGSGEPAMCVNDFSSFFEIFAILNLGFATSDRFQYALNNDILSLSTGLSAYLKKQVQELKNKLVVAAFSQATHQKILAKINKIHSTYDKYRRKIEDSEKYRRDFTPGFKSMFLTTSLYCIVILTIAGFEQFFSGQWQTNVTLTFLCTILLYNFVIFIRSFTGLFNKEVSPWYAFTIVSLVTGLSYYTCANCPAIIEYAFVIEEQMLMIIAMAVAASPYKFHVLRVVVHKIAYPFAIICLLLYTNLRLNRINRHIDWIIKP